MPSHCLLLHSHKEIAKHPFDTSDTARSCHLCLGTNDPRSACKSVFAFRCDDCVAVCKVLQADLNKYNEKS